MTWVAAAIVGAGALGAGAGIYGANKQAGAADKASQQQYAMYDQTRSDLQPWMTYGEVGLDELGKLLGINSQGSDPLNSYFLSPFTLDKFQQSPGYQFRLDEGMKAINKGAASRGMYYAPQTLQDLGKYQQGLASTEFENAYGRYNTDLSRQYGMLSNLVNSGQNAAAGLGGIGQQAATNAGQFGTAGAAAQAGGYMGAANAVGGAGLGLANYGMYLSQLQQPAYGGNLQPIAATR
jgi:hypothetical protein